METSKIQLPAGLGTYRSYAFCGYDTFGAELCRIFGVHRSTFEARMGHGWPLEAALTAETKRGWNVKNAYVLAAQPAVKEYCQAKMDAFFDERDQFIPPVHVNQAPELAMPIKVREFLQSKGATK